MWWSKKEVPVEYPTPEQRAWLETIRVKLNEGDVKMIRDHHEAMQRDESKFNALQADLKSLSAIIEIRSRPNQPLNAQLAERIQIIYEKLDAIDAAIVPKRAVKGKENGLKKRVLKRKSGR